MQLRSVMVAACLSLMVACGRDFLPAQVPVESVDELEGALETAGVPVDHVEGRAPEIPHAESQIWRVRGDTIFVYSLGEGADVDQALARLTGSASLLSERDREIQIWERASFLVIYPGSEGGVVLLLSGLLGDPRTRQVSGPDEPYPPAISAAQQKLSDDLGVPPSAIDVINYEPVAWPDSCLGLAAESEICAQVETSGWRIELSVDGESYSLRSDAIGLQVRRTSEWTE